MKYDFVVIGAGVSGLTSALVLAQSGYHVAVVEKSPQVCPLLRGFSRKGVHFDTGFHYTGGLGAGESLDIIFRYLGLSGHLTSFPFREDGFDIFRSIQDEFEFHFPTGYDLIREKLVSAFPAEQTAIDRYLQLVRTTCSSMPYLNLEIEFGDTSTLQGLDDTTLQETLDALTDNKLLKALLSMHCVLYGVAPNEARFIQHACIVGNYYQSARGIRGGGLSLAKAYETRLKELGIDLFCGSKVSGIAITAQGAVSGVTLDNGIELTCSGCMSTVHPGTMLDMLPENIFRPAYRNRIRGLQETISAYLIYAVSDKAIPFLAGANLFVFPDVDSLNNLGSRSVEENMLYLTGAYRGMSTEPTGFIGISPAPFSQTSAWQDSVSGKRPVAYREFKDDVIARLSNHIDRFCPELRGTMQYIEGSTPLTVRDFNNTPLGGLYGIKHMAGQHNPFPVTKVKGLFLAGQAIVSPGVMGAVLSAFIACGNILGHDRLRKELKACS
jgi:all-trans-retinol 13,14-reductase